MNKELVQHARDIAKANYNLSYGWSVFTECYDDDDYVEFVEDLSTLKEVEDMMEDIVSIWDDRMDNANIERGRDNDGAGNY
tara:strand:- start:1817 stop:2059 length:243 start_codon:yes stop_codon:yes gene_type:complete